MSMRKLSRREFVRLAGIAGAGATVAACAAPTPQVVKETVVVEKSVEKQVVQTQVVEKSVEKVVTATPLPAITTPQGRQLPPDAAPLEKQIYYEAGGEPKHLDLVRDLYSSAQALNWGAEPLLRLNNDQEIVPALAESYKAAPDGSYWEFTIRKDAKWSDGEPITADDAVFTYLHALKPEFANPWAFFYYDIKGALAYNQGKAGPDALGVTKVDDRTFRIAGENGPVPHLPAMMTYQAMVLAPKHKAEKDPEHWADTAEGFVSSGPFALTKWDHNKQLVWEQNQYYNGPFKPGIVKVIQIIGTPQTDWFNSWLNHEIDIMGSLTAPQMAQVRSDPKLNALLHWWTDPQTEWIAWDTAKPPFDNVKFRMALARSVDRATLAQKVMNGTVTPGATMLPPGFPAYNADLEKVQAFDVDAAKKLLEEAGYKDGKDASGKQVEFTIDANGRDPKVEFCQQQWQDNLGIKVNIKVWENAAWRAARGSRELGIFKNGYEYDYMDPANLLTQLWRSKDETGSLQHRWVSKDFDNLVTEAGKTTDYDARMKLYQQAEQVLVEQAPAVFLSHVLIFQTWFPYISGFQPNKKGEIAYRYLDISRFEMYITNEVDKYRKA